MNERLETIDYKRVWTKEEVERLCPDFSIWITKRLKFLTSQDRALLQTREMLAMCENQNKRIDNIHNALSNLLSDYDEVDSMYLRLDVKMNDHQKNIIAASKSLKEFL